MHHPYCDVNDQNIEGIRKPCNCPPGWSALPALEPAGPASSLAVATGWVPVSSAERLVAAWLERAKFTSGCAASEAGAEKDFWKAKTAAYQLCAEQLRREIAAATVRQPAPNTEGETRRPSAPHSP
jgi:hypothetical protein